MSVVPCVRACVRACVYNFHSLDADVPAQSLCITQGLNVSTIPFTLQGNKKIILFGAKYFGNCELISSIPVLCIGVAIATVTRNDRFYYVPLIRRHTFVKLTIQHFFGYYFSLFYAMVHRLAKKALSAINQSFTVDQNRVKIINT